MPKRAATIDDVAREAGVSRTTAIFALNHSQRVKLAADTRRRVIETAQRLGYRRNGLASALSRGKTGTIGIIARLPGDDGSQAPGLYIGAAVLGIMQVATRHGLRTTLLPTSREHPLSVDEAVDQRVDGLILVSLADQDDDMLARGIYASGFPCVSTGSGYAERRIAADNHGGASQAVEHLIALGHRRIGYLNQGEGFSMSSWDRFQGVGDTLERHRIPFDRDAACVPVEKAQTVLARPASERPSAFLCFNDWVASEGIRMAYRQGLRVPEDMSFVGFDNSVVAESCHPRLTTVHASMQAQAEAALNVLDALWHGEEPVIPLPLPTQLVIRESTAPPLL